ncbi:unnamed protein product, partial [Musa textilis]
LVASLRRERLPTSSRSTFTPFPLRSIKSSTRSLVAASRTRSCRLCPSRNRAIPTSAPGSRLSSLLLTPTAMLASASSAPRRSPPPSVAPSFLPTSRLSLL